MWRDCQDYMVDGGSEEYESLKDEYLYNNKENKQQIHDLHVQKQYNKF